MKKPPPKVEPKAVEPKPTRPDPKPAERIGGLKKSEIEAEMVHGQQRIGSDADFVREPTSVVMTFKLAPIDVHPCVVCGHPKLEKCEACGN